MSKEREWVEEEKELKGAERKWDGVWGQTNNPAHGRQLNVVFWLVPVDLSNQPACRFRWVGVPGGCELRYRNEFMQAIRSHFS